MTEGPLLETLLQRLVNTPAEFLAEPRLGRKGQVHVAAVVSDLLRDLGGLPLTPEQAQGFSAAADAKARNFLRAVLVACWLLHDDWFIAQHPETASILTWLETGIIDLAELVSAGELISDPDRREELARLGLQALDVYPAGETPEQAQDRLSTLNSRERRRVLAASRAAEKRAQEIRAALARKAAEEAAPKYSRE